ncbi:TPA: antitoxin VbhA family protein [Clostridioides difficile]
MKDYSIKNTTKEQRKEIVNSALGIVSIDSHEVSGVILELSDRYIEGALEIEEIQNIVLSFYKNKYLDGDESIETLENYILILEEEKRRNNVVTDEEDIEKMMDEIIDQNIDALKKLSE